MDVHCGSLDQGMVAIHLENMEMSGNLKVIRENVLFLWCIVVCNVMDRN